VHEFAAKNSLRNLRCTAEWGVRVKGNAAKIENTTLPLPKSPPVNFFLQTRDQCVQAVMRSASASNFIRVSRSARASPCVELIQRFDSSSRPPGDSGKLSVSRSNQHAVLCVVQSRPGASRARAQEFRLPDRIPIRHRYSSTLLSLSFTFSFSLSSSFFPQSAPNPQSHDRN
jgi:hypothetical protein